MTLNTESLWENKQRKDLLDGWDTSPTTNYCCYIDGRFVFANDVLPPAGTSLFRIFFEMAKENEEEGWYD